MSRAERSASPVAAPPIVAPVVSPSVAHRVQGPAAPLATSPAHAHADRPAATAGFDPARHRRAQAAIARPAGTLDGALGSLAADAPAQPAAATALAAVPIGKPARAKHKKRRKSVAVGRLAAPGWTPAVQRAFVEHLAVHGCVDQAARHIGLSRQSAYQLRQRVPNSVFALAWETVMMLARRSLIDIATERAINGREEAVWSRGEMVGTRVVHNDRMLMFLIGHKPEPLHSTLTNPELHQLWPNMLHEIDAILPPAMSKADAKLRLAAQGDIGND